ncbi:MAG: beta-galactosidase GalB [Luteolibacter sp.]
MKPIYSLIFIAALTAHARAEDVPVRERISFNQDWRFRKGDTPDAADRLSYDSLKLWLLPTGNAFRETAAPTPAEPFSGTFQFAEAGWDDQGWRKLDLPHDWGIEGPFDQALPGETAKLPWHGTAWYRKSFVLPKSDQDQIVSLEIDGAMSYSTVWCNGKLVGGWPYGYSSYQVDLTPYLRPGQKNTLAIRVDNPPESSRWYPGGGIYRNVWLSKTSPVHIAQWGTSLTTPKASAESATVNLDFTLGNEAKTSATIKVSTEYFLISRENGTPKRTLVGSSPAMDITLAAGKTTTANLSYHFKNPQLWSPENPNRYVAVTTVKIDGKIVDRYETTFGIRSAEFTANDGFHLNGKRVPIKGVCMHHDLGALGAAFNTRAAQRQIEILKEMGVNAIRMSHNPPAPELLDLCDEMGILVMDELADCWKKAKKKNGYNRIFDDWSEADVRAMARRDRNHPSVIIWSIGNEIPEQGSPVGIEIGNRLKGFLHKEETARPVTIGVNSVSGGYNGFQTVVDIFGYNYKPGEYAKFHQKNPQIPLYGSETSSTVSSRGEYAFPVTEDKSQGLIGFQMSSYDLYAPKWATTADAEFRAQEENPNVAGEFVWTGFDYLGEPTPFNDDNTNVLNYHTEEDRARAKKELEEIGKIIMPSRSSYFGIVDLAGFKKDRFYLYQAHWRPELPMAHILPHWNWPERIGQVTPVHVYTSGDEAELFLNGKSLGRKTKAKLEYRLRWDDVTYQSGELKVVSYKNGKPWAEDVVKTTGSATKLHITADRAAITADGKDLSFVTVSVQDQNGLDVPRSNPALKFEIKGPGEIVATDNGDATDHTSFQSHERKAFNGLALVIVKLKPGATEPVTLTATSEGLTTASTTISPAK